MKKVHVTEGTALDQETIVRLRSYIEDEVSKTVCFDKTTISMSMNKDGSFSFTLRFWIDDK